MSRMKSIPDECSQASEFVTNSVRNQWKRIEKIKLSSSQKKTIEKVFGLKTLFQLGDIASSQIVAPNCIEELAHGVKRIDLPSDSSYNSCVAICRNIFFEISRDILDEISCAINQDKESLSYLLGAFDDQSILSLYHYPNGSYTVNHNDKGLLTFIYSPYNKNIRDVYGYPVNLQDDELAVIAGTALKEATKTSLSESGFVQTTNHSVSSCKYNMIYIIINA